MTISNASSNCEDSSGDTQVRISHDKAYRHTAIKYTVETDQEQEKTINDENAS